MTIDLLFLVVSTVQLLQLLVLPMLTKELENIEGKANLKTPI